MRRAFSLVLALVLVACTGGESIETTTTSSTTSSSSSTTTTTTRPTTTTTLPPVVEVDGIETGPLTNYISSYYAYATGRSDAEPVRVPKPLVPEPGSHPNLDTVKGEVAFADYNGTRLAVWQSDKDLLGLVRNDKGWRIVAGRAPSIGVRAWYTNDPIILAVVGSDARPDEVATATRADSIHFVAMDGRGGAALVGVPRDSWVSIPDYGTSKINASLWAGGPDMMMATFADLSGLEFDGYLLTGFSGFEAMVNDVLLPFEFEVPFTFSDRAAKADFNAGRQALDGKEALSFVRARKAFTSGDFQRQLNGGTFLIGALIAAKVRGPLAFPQMIVDSAAHVFTDLSPAEMLRIALTANAVKISEVGNVVLQGGTSTTSGGASIVVLSSSAAEETFADLADGTLGGG